MVHTKIYPGEKPGFTLIEIVLVLAIAGLLLIVVLLAVSGAQRGRRDYQRKQDLSRLMAALVQYTSNHQGTVPTDQASLDDVMTHYVSNAKDPGLGNYTLTFRDIDAPQSDIPIVGTIYYQQGHWCNRGDHADPANPSDPIAGDDTLAKKFAVWTGLEVGSANSVTTAYACEDNL